MNQKNIIHGLAVLFACVIMKVVMTPIRVGFTRHVAVNETTPLSGVGLSRKGAELSSTGSLVTLSEAFKTTNGFSLEMDNEINDYDFEDVTDANSSDTTPEYMLELYNKLSRNTPFLHNSNIIRSFKHMPQHNGLDATNDTYISDCIGCRIHSLHFDISTISRTESINIAELRLYTLIKRDQNSYLGVNRHVKIYEVLNVQDSDGITKYKYITSKYIHKLENAWESFDVTAAVKRSLQAGSQTEHLEVRIQSMVTEHTNDNLDINADPYHIKQPILVVYSNDKPEHERLNDRHEVIMHELTSKTTSSGHNYYTDATDSRSIHGKYGPKDVILSRSKRSRNNRNSGCRRRPMYVNFADINYDSWIIAPRGYQAYQCAGRCYVPISENLSPSNHAVIQALLHLNYHRRAGKVCCVPTQLDPISLLYIDKHGVVTYKYMFDGMVVAKCGCR